MVTEILVVSLFDERRGGPLDSVGERESVPYEALSEKGRRALLCARILYCSLLLSVSVRICSRWDFCDDTLPGY